MQPIQINVQVNVGLNAELCTLLSAVLNHPARVAELPAAPKPSKPAKPQPKPEVTNEPAEGKAEAAKDTPEPQPAPEPEPQEETDPEQAGQKEYTVVDVRAAMDRTRRRIEGEDYKENPDGEGYKRWHRTLTGWFKNTAAALGAEKPSALPNSESIEKFIQCCDAVQVKGDELVEDCPF